MNSKAFSTAIGVSAVFAIVGYFLGGAMGGEGSTLAIGIIMGGIVAALVASLAGAPRAESSDDAEGDAGDEVPAASGDAVTLFVGNLTQKTRRQQVEELFAPYGKVVSVRIAQDRATRRSRGFGFVVMNKAGADAAIKAVDGMNFYGRNLKVSVAKEQKSERPV